MEEQHLWPLFISAAEKAARLSPNCYVKTCYLDYCGLSSYTEKKHCAKHRSLQCFFFLCFVFLFCCLIAFPFYWSKDALAKSNIFNGWIHGTPDLKPKGKENAKKIKKIKTLFKWRKSSRTFGSIWNCHDCFVSGPWTHRVTVCATFTP